MFDMKSVLQEVENPPAGFLPGPTHKSLSFHPCWPDSRVTQACNPEAFHTRELAQAQLEVASPIALMTYLVHVFPK